LNCESLLLTCKLLLVSTISGYHEAYKTMRNEASCPSTHLPLHKIKYHLYSSIRVYIVGLDNGARGVRL